MSVGGVSVTLFPVSAVSVEDLLLGGVILFFAYFVRGMTGFGSGLIAVPLLAHLAPLRLVVPLVLVTDFTASVILGRSLRQHIRGDEIVRLIPASIAGIIAGILLLLRLPKQPMLFALGCIVIIFGIRSVLNLHGRRLVSRFWAIPAGLLGGLVGAMFGTGGPPYVIYLTHRLHDKAQLRATFSGLFLLDGGVRIAGFLISGLLLQPDLLSLVPLALPALLLGLWLGHRVHAGLSQSMMVRLIGLILVLSGVSLLWRSLA